MAGLLSKLLMDGSIPTPRPRPTGLINALQQYPGLGNPDVGYTYNPQPNSQNFLEYWAGNEPGDKSYPRPSALPMGKPGIEVTNPATRPVDIAADLVSHGLVNSDPKLGGYYNQFKQSMTPQQQGILQDQYQYAQQQGEKRPFDQWSEASGTPAYFRGYAFDQWPKEETSKYYNPDQVKMFDDMIDYLKTPKR